MSKQMYLNLPVKDLNKSINFFTSLGFTFNPKFTDKNATCMIVGENIYVMLLVEEFFKTFINARRNSEEFPRRSQNRAVVRNQNSKGFVTKEISNAKKTTEAIIGIGLASKKEVDEIYNRAIKAGAIESNAPYDYGWMYGKSFSDLDGHIWEFFFIDESKAPQNSTPNN